MNNIISSIDIGSNSIAILIVKYAFKKISILYENAFLSHLATGFTNDNLISEKSVSRSVFVLNECKKINKQFNVNKTICVATSALRHAANKTLILSQFNALGLFPKIISGDNEAKYISSVIKYEFPYNLNNTLVVDIGGGSTEFLHFKNSKLVFLKSLDFGTVTLYKKMFSTDPIGNNEIINCNKFIISKLQGLTLLDKSFESIIGVGGTVSSLCAIRYKVEPFNQNLIHKKIFSYLFLKKINNSLFRKKINERKKIIGLSPKRAKTLPAGSLILNQIMRINGFEKIVVCERGLRWGVLIEHLKLA